MIFVIYDQEQLDTPYAAFTEFDKCVHFVKHTLIDDLIIRFMAREGGIIEEYTKEQFLRQYSIV